jgi:hypothetical protein
MGTWGISCRRVYISYRSKLCSPNKQHQHDFRPDTGTDQSLAVLAPVSLWVRKWVRPASLLSSLSPVLGGGCSIAWTHRTGCWGHRWLRVLTFAVRSRSGFPFPMWLLPWGMLARNTPSERRTFLRCWQRAGAQQFLAGLQQKTTSNGEYSYR